MLRAGLRPLLLTGLLIFSGCGSRTSPPEPAASVPTETLARATAPAAPGPPSADSPLEQFKIHLDDFHFTSGQPEDQVEVQHYCSRVSPDITQCVLFDGDGPQARLVGVEYVISGRLFASLPPEEQRLWHSYAYAVRSGQLISPGLSPAAEHVLMEELASAYSKAFHTWHTQHSPELPRDIPALMMGFTRPGQLYPHLIEQRDRRCGISTADKMRARRDIRIPPADPDAGGGRGRNAWQMALVRAVDLPLADSLTAR